MEENEMTDFPALTLFTWGRKYTVDNETLEQLNNENEVSQFVRAIYWTCDKGEFDFCDK